MAYSLYPSVWAARLGAMEKLVLMRLADHADAAGANVFPAVPTVASACGITDRAVQKAIARFRLIGLLVETKRADFAKRRPTEYRLDLGVLASLGTIAGEPDSPVKDIHRCTTFTPPVNDVRGTGEPDSPKPLIEPSIEPEEEEERAIAPPTAHRWEGSTIRLTEADYQKLQASFPRVADFDAELSTADAWLVDNPDKAKGWWLFLNRWLKKANEAQQQQRPSLGDAFAHARSLRGV